MEKLTNIEMMNISGGQVETCEDFAEVVHWLDSNGHGEQSEIIRDLYQDQYCG